VGAVEIGIRTWIPLGCHGLRPGTQGQVHMHPADLVKKRQSHSPDYTEQGSDKKERG